MMVLGSRFKLGEPVMRKIPLIWKDYCKNFDIDEE
jgi:hypothetical protein